MVDTSLVMTHVRAAVKVPRRGAAGPLLAAILITTIAPTRGAAEEAEEAPEIIDEIIVVTGTRLETPLAASPVVTEVIDRARIEEAGAETVADALATRPGLWLERAIGGTAISMQGLGPKYVLVLVDGQRQLGRVDGAIDLERFAAGAIEQIEIVRGPGSAVYGADALGGVVNLVTRAPDEPRGELGVRVDHRRASDLHAALGGGRGRWSAAATGEWRRGDAFDRTPADARTTIAAYDDARGDVHGRYRASDAWRADVTAGYQRRALAGVDARATGAVIDRRNLIEIASAATTVTRTGEGTRGWLRLGGGYYRDQYAADQRGGSALDQYQDTREHQLEAAAMAEHRLAPRHLAGAGIELLSEGLSSARLATDGRRRRAAVWVQDEWRPGAGYAWLVVPAARIDADTQFGVHATPRLAARWDARDDVVARVSLGLGYRAPSFKEQLLRFENPGAGYVVEGNPDLRPETSRSLQLGAEWRPRAWAWLAATTYANDLTDLIAAVTLAEGGAGMPIRFGYANVGRARTAGGELAATLARGRLALELGYAYTFTRDLDRGRALEGIPAQRASVAVRWRDPDEALTAVVETAVTGARPYALADAMVETRARVDVRARVARRFGEALELHVGGENLLDAGDDTFDPIPPRTLYAGATARL